MDFFNSTSFDDHVQKLIEEWKVPGLAVAVSQGKIIKSKGYGFANLDPPKACDGDTIFDLASSSKSMTAGSVGLLVADEKFPNVTWNTKMCDLLPDDFVMSEDSYTKDITVEDILGHRTGLPRHDMSYLGIRSKSNEDARSVTRNLRNLQLAAPIRTKYLYNNIMYTVATHLVENISGKSFAEFLDEHFFKPLDMSFTRLQPDAMKEAGLGDHLAIPYQWSESANSYRACPYQQCPEAQGAGSIMTSVNDYIKWVRAIMYQQGPITKEVYEGMTKARIILDPESSPEDRQPFMSFEGYAAGLGVKYYRGHQIISHDGSVPGFGSCHFFMPAFEFGGVVLGNSGSSADIVEAVAMELVDAMLGVPQPERVDWNARAREADRRYRLKEKEESVMKELAPELEEPQVLKMPLDVYCGEYWNVGYHGIKIEIKNGKLFVDASDRCMGFYLTLEHLKDQTLFVAKREDFFDGECDELAAEFRFVNDRVTKLGLRFEDDIDDYIWFDRVRKEGEEKDVAVR